jgi:hypothetical protein
MAIPIRVMEDLIEEVLAGRQQLTRAILPVRRRKQTDVKENEVTCRWLALSAQIIPNPLLATAWHNDGYCPAS